jgi:hypothetical protein
MQRQIDVLLKLSLFVFLLTGLLGFYFLSNGQEADALLCAKMGGSASLVFSTIALLEVITLENMRFSKKFFWVVSMVLFQIFMALAYYLVGRKFVKQPESDSMNA